MLRSISFIIVFIFLAALTAFTQGPESNSGFTPFDQWKSAVTTNDTERLKQLYSTDPLVVVQTPLGESKGPEQELKFWPATPVSGRTGMSIEVAKSEQLPDGSHHIQFITEFRVRSEKGLRTWYVRSEQIWHKVKDGGWRIVATGRGSMARLKQPSKTDAVLYSSTANPYKDISTAIIRATAEHKRILLDFGGNWCYDCHVLEIAFHNPDIAPTLQATYILVHVDIGNYDKNIDIAEKYRIPLKKGVPALAVLDSNGKLLFSQTTGEFENARSMDPEDIIDFLNKWKAPR
jgi:ketosteroid isomerase-like protein